jgi:hypothetical protein
MKYFITDLNEFYYKIPDEKPIHIARVWGRYGYEGTKLIVWFSIGWPAISFPCCT